MKKGYGRGAKKPVVSLNRATPWVEKLEDILDEAIRLVEDGYEVECMSKYVGKVEYVCFYAGKALPGTGGDAVDR